METKSKKLVLSQETLKNLTTEAAAKPRGDRFFKSQLSIPPPCCTPVGAMN
jgi:hypothetical protein